ncbi:hypothetical protein H6F39_11385 [Anabaena sp. FACHB-1250]|uniref:WD40 domain-containing protein n=2 Tax=Dolichospermum TaxID=748770 RepID=A0A480AID7_9CYAN|nr:MULTISPECIES: hypothetical protein [Nostocales]MBD2141954.1 hypothetical protein [Anabaena sp. FACHB-1250]MBD2269766.1 hypothetical protein [Anabaena sp. FACHB-1391]MBE9219580.1 hypothetical protein [Dolichospermum flos-aquae LEGE 04289]GCL43523.1 hypothetical protein NIES80_32390 [Dolichospermum planctonicum]
MLKSLLVLGWFRVKPYIKYIAISIVISPFVGMSLHATLAKQSQVANTNLENDKSEANGKINLQFAQVNSQTGKISIGEGIQSLSTNKVITEAKTENHRVENNLVKETAPSVDVVEYQEQISVNQVNLSQKLKNRKEEAEFNSLENQGSESEVLATSATSTVIPEENKFQPPETGEIPVIEEKNESEMTQNDPIGSPHPIPWQWIMSTQEAIGGKGLSGVRYYRSLPVVSPDGKYAIYSRVQMEVKPEMHNSRVKSVLFMEDRQTKRLRVMTSTDKEIDPLLNKEASLSEEADNDGKIGVLVPVSWSEKGDRFLARKFVAVFNTADATDQAVIWNRQQNNINVVNPVQSEDDHEKIAILLGWSKKQPNNVLFRAGELGEENWPLVQVANDGKTVDMSAEEDQPITFGESAKIWADPQVASR